MSHRTGIALCLLLPSCLTARVWDDIDQVPAPRTVARHQLAFSEIGVVDGGERSSPYLAFHVAPSDTLEITAKRPWLICAGVADYGVTAAVLTDELELHPSDGALEVQTSLGTHGPKLVAHSILSGRCSPGVLGAVLAPGSAVVDTGTPPTHAEAWVRVTKRPWLQWLTDDRGLYSYRLVSVLDPDGHPIPDLAPIAELRTDNTPEAWRRLHHHTFLLAAESADGGRPIYIALLGSAVRVASVVTIEHRGDELQWSLEEHWGVTAHLRYPGALPLPARATLAAADWRAELRVRERIGQSTFWDYATAAVMTPFALVLDAAMIGALVVICSDPGC